MTDKPILFSAPMVRALFAGTKTQTRRILKPQPECVGHMGLGSDIGFVEVSSQEGIYRIPRLLRWAIGDRLWVRERLERANGEAVGYPADGTWLPNTSWEWQRSSISSIHMPRRFSRLTLTVTDVRVQQLQDISKEDVIAEGITERCGFPIADVYAGWHEPYAELWESINGPGSWYANPWIVAVTFTTEKRNVDAPR